MTRHDPSSQAGWVKWPSNEDASPFRDGGEGGMTAYAAWSPSLEDPKDWGNRALVCCDGLTAFVAEAEVFLGATGPDAGEYHLAGWRSESEGTSGYYVEAVILLGSTGGTWFDEGEGLHFLPTVADLSETGQAVLRSLSELYGLEPVILTFLDT